ncbi:lactonase family protein [Demequina sp.]|uniref:lactonase family protein n=1 Tax=Demequina sp. TaxID=2050685 RepID=UPI003A847EF9
MTDTVWWGTFPEAGIGTEAGLGEALWRSSEAGLDRAVLLPSPAFVVAHPMRPLLYVVSELPTSQIAVVEVSDPAAPAVIANVDTGSPGACHLLLARDVSALYVAHYTSGDLAVIALDEDGVPVQASPTQVFPHAGSGPRADRQEGPHAHFSGYAPGGEHLLVCDLGTDELRRYRVQPDGLLEADGIAATLPGGSGPRHFAVRADLIYVACELDSHLRVLRWDGPSATAELIEELPSTTAPNRTSDSGPADSHILIHEDVVLLGVRGPDVISLFDLSPEGMPRYRTSLDVGHWPRHFAVTDQHLHVAVERGHEARTYALADVLALPPEPEVGFAASLAHASALLPSAACACPA